MNLKGEIHLCVGAHHWRMCVCWCASLGEWMVFRFTSNDALSLSSGLNFQFLPNRSQLVQFSQHCNGVYTHYTANQRDYDTIVMCLNVCKRHLPFFSFDLLPSSWDNNEPLLRIASNIPQVRWSHLFATKGTKRSKWDWIAHWNRGPSFSVFAFFSSHYKWSI